MPLGLDVAASVELNYRVKGQSRGELWDSVATLRWDQDGAQYSARYELMKSPTGARIMTSSGRITASGIAPARFSDKGRSELAAHFRRDRNQVTFSANVPPVAIKPGSQDRLSILFQLSALISGNPELLKDGNAITVHAVGTRDAADWTFKVLKSGKENDGAAGSAAWRLVREAEGDFDQSIEIWLAPSRPFLPERWRVQQRNGDWVDHQLIADVSV